MCMQKSIEMSARYYQYEERRRKGEGEGEEPDDIQAGQPWSIAVLKSVIIQTLPEMV